jgi:hypothetical protein
VASVRDHLGLRERSGASGDQKQRRDDEDAGIHELHREFVGISARRPYAGR